MKFLRIFLFIFILLVLCPEFFSFNVTAGTEDAEMKDFKLTATPYRQGIGGEITIVASISFFGGCCYALWAYDVKATIVIPENVTIIKGATTQKIDEVEATEGGAATIVHFKWIIKSIIPDTYTIKVDLATKNCGDVKGEVKVEVIEGCSMTIPLIYPDIPNTDSDTFIMIDVSSGLEGIEVEKVELFYIRTQDLESYNLKKLMAENDTLKWSGDNRKGTQIKMERIKDISNTWKGEIPSSKNDATIYYWIVAKDNNGKNTTSIVYSFDVIEIDRIFFIVDILNWLPIIGTIIGIIIILFLFNIVRTPTISNGLFLLGSRSIKILNDSQNNNYNLQRLNLKRNVIAVILLIISIILFFWAIYSGYFEQFAHLNGGI